MYKHSVKRTSVDVLKERAEERLHTARGLNARVSLGTLGADFAIVDTGKVLWLPSLWLPVLPVIAASRPFDTGRFNFEAEDPTVSV